MDLYYVCLICNKVVIDLLLENETVEIKWSNVNKKRYTNLGYCFTKNGDSFYPKVKDVLFCSSGIKIPVVCDYCGQIYYPTTTTYLKSKSSTKKDCCVKCKGIEIKSTVQLDIEYDGWYFHKDRKDQDRKRNFFVGNKGYKIIRFLAYVDRLPTKEELVNAVNYLLQTNKKFIQIELT